MSLGHLAVLGAGSLCLECGIGRRGGWYGGIERCLFHQDFPRQDRPGKAALLCHAGRWSCQQLDSRGGRVQKDTIIATVNEDEIELERKELEVKILKDRIAKEEELSKLENSLKR